MYARPFLSQAPGASASVRGARLETQGGHELESIGAHQLGRLDRIVAMNSFLFVGTPENLAEQGKRERIKQMLAEFTTAMLVTRGLDGGLHARPLSIAGTREDGALYFSTSVESGKVHQVEDDANVNVALQGGHRFVSLTGTASVVRDRALIDRLWSESWRIWFPQGKDDPSLCVLVVQPSEAAYWDMSGAKGLKYLLQMAKGYLTHQRPPSDSDEGHTGRVKL